ncbi:uncharacterized protein [Anoplolepis gracilipes]|uniref:uncharacterized protein n=1 Tax=Anoplolepis gracilipes TaxID=354296 RepID=UPI003BA34278
MDHDNLWEVTIIPSQATSSNDTIILSKRTLSTINEQNSKRDLSFNENKDGNGCRNAEKSKITSISSTYKKLNHDISHPSFQSDKQSIRVLSENEKKLHDGINTKIKRENTYSQTYPGTNNTSNTPFVELGAIYKILDFITDSDLKVSSLTNNCCNKISRILRCLLAQHNDKRLEDLLLNDSSLYKCKRCQVISYILGLRPATEEIKRNRTKARTRDTEITTAECDCINNDQNKKELKISINLSDLKDNVYSRIFVDRSKVDCQAKYKDELNEIESLPDKKHAFAMRNCIGNPNRVNNTSAVKIKHKSRCKNNTIKKLFTDFETTKRNKKYDYNSIVQNNNLSRCESSTAIKADIGKEEIVRKISYERKSQIDDILAGNMRSKIAQEIHGSQRLFEKHSDIYPVIDTIKYLARGQFTILDKHKDELLAKLREKRRLENARKEHSNILYSSRDDYPQRNSGFWLFDETGHLPEIVLDEYRYLSMPRMDGNRENVHSSPNSSRRSNTREKTKNTDGNWCNYIEKDSLEDCTLLEQRRESDTTTFSSSSAENLIHEYIESLDKNKYEINDIDRNIPRGRRLVSSRASLDIARHVRAQIANDRRSDNRKKSIRQLRVHDSDIFARLSPKIRRKICHLIQNISSSSAKDSLFYHGKCLMTDALNNEKLQHSKSVNASFVHSSEITNNCTNDCISTKLSELLEDKNNLFKKLCKDNFANTCNQNSNKDSVKILNENMAIFISPDKLGKTRLSDNFTRKVTQHIIYKDASLKDIDNDDEHTVTDISTIYRKILQNSENMDWDNFQKLVEILHPDEKELWRDICKTISEEAKKIADDADDNTEVCIEISPSINPENTLKTFRSGKVTECVREIVFELDMTLKDVEAFFNKKLHLAEKHLDIHKNADESTTMDWNNDERKTISKKTH